MDLTQLMQNKKMVVLIVLGLLAFVSLIYGVFSGSGHRTSTSFHNAVIDINTKDSSSLSENFSSVARRAKRTQYRSWKRSPFIPKGVPGAPHSKFALNGILASGKELKAMLGDAIVGKGDRVDATTTVVEVRKDRIILNDGTKDYELKLEQ